MSSSLVHNSYGKSRVRVTKVIRHNDRHEVKELLVNVQLEGKFEDTYVTGDNSLIVATDSMKNTVYVLAAEHPLDCVESFARALARHFLDKYPHVTSVSVHILEDLWQRIWTEGKDHRHAFVSAGDEKRVALVNMDRQDEELEAGIENLLVLKTTDSEFWGFIRDEYTSLPEVRDRIFATSIIANWIYNGSEVDYNSTYKLVRQTMLDVFAKHHSLSVQQTLLVMGQEVLDAVSAVEEISISMPNQHRIPFDLSRFGKENKNAIFVPTDEPYGLINGTVRR